MAKLTVEIPEEIYAWIMREVEQGRATSIDSFVRRAIRKERERADEDYRYSDEDIADMLGEARESGLAPEKTVDEIFAEVMRKMEHHRNRVA